MIKLTISASDEARAEALAGPISRKRQETGLGDDLDMFGVLRLALAIGFKELESRHAPAVVVEADLQPPQLGLGGTAGMPATITRDLWHPDKSPKHAVIKAQQAGLTWVNCGEGVYRWDHHPLGDKVTVELRRGTGTCWFLTVRGLGVDRHEEIVPITPIPSGNPPFGPALHALQVIINQALLQAIVVAPKPEVEHG